ncbi:hypothetical protein EDF46_3398 [Frondihabitans sp. PhB188]|uniref:hypothetical protein n=1 Tax=Frondihabitans sp. PhB188 TaxID=2485200 RepID=UPI000F4992E4|nr:hypothetical protein [Frondihabitans sp. PhB188]ROQ30888.1 hypothetical protein EDF46_3398 [Frondihabitans sp. PhB188]
MIHTICLIAFVLVVVLRARSSWRKPAWWATAFGAVSIATYGIFWATPAVMDSLLRSRNILTLVRDSSAVAAMWFFHNAVATQRHRPERKLPLWALALAVVAFAVPFLLIRHPGPTSADFVLDRLQSFPTWLFSSVYISIMGVLAASVLALLRFEKSIMTRLYMLGISLMLVGSGMEVAYLFVAHFVPGTTGFAHDFYNVAEGPFFGGIFIGVLGVAWVLGVRNFWKYLARWTLRIDARAHDTGYQAQILLKARVNGWSDRQLAMDSAVNIRDRLKVGAQTLSKADDLVFTGVERMLSAQLQEASR